MRNDALGVCDAIYFKADKMRSESLLHLHFFMNISICILYLGIGMERGIEDFGFYETNDLEWILKSQLFKVIKLNEWCRKFFMRF